jgi:hypothetical protein
MRQVIVNIEREVCSAILFELVTNLFNVSQPAQRREKVARYLMRSILGKSLAEDYHEFDTIEQRS